MSYRTLLLLSQGRPADDRDRRLLLAGAIALAGALLIAAGRLLQLRGYVEVTAGYSNYVTEPGLRQGVVIATLLLTVPLLALAYQAVQLGSTARRRRTQQLILAGATPQQAQAISALQAVRSAVLGGAWAGPVYVALSLSLGAEADQHHRLLPDPSALDLVSWVLVVALSALVAAAADVLAGRPRTSRPRWGRVIVAAAAVALTVALLLLGGDSRSSATQGAVVVAGSFLVLVAAISLGPVLLLAVVRWQQRRPGAVNLLASSRTMSDLRGPGRVAAVLLIAGLVVGFETGVSTLQSGDPGFYRTGEIMTAVAVGVAVFVALLTLVVGAAEQLLDAARPMASMRALGVDDVTLRRVQQRQLASATVPSSALGLLIGSLFGHYLHASGVTPALWSLAAAATGAVAIELLCFAATWTLSRRRTAATDIDHLRTT